MRIIGFNPYKEYPVVLPLGNNFHGTLADVIKSLQGDSMAELSPAYPSFQEFIEASKLLISKGRARTFDDTFRHALWIAPGYPISMIQGRDPSVDPDLPQSQQATGEIPESRKAGQAHDTMGADTDDPEELLDRLEDRVKTVENQSQQDPAFKTMGVGSWFAIVQLLFKLGQLAFTR